ncbi:MAG: hypothetical protein WC436_00220 [Candidatus Babeliales bacterium]
MYLIKNIFLKNNKYFLLIFLFFKLFALQAVNNEQKPIFSRDLAISYKQIFCEQIFDYFLNSKAKNLSEYKKISLSLSYLLAGYDEQFLQKLIDLQKIANSKIEILLTNKILSKKYLANLRLYVLKKNYDQLINDRNIDSEFIVNEIQKFCKANKINLTSNTVEMLKINIFDFGGNKKIVEDYCDLTHAYCVYKNNSKNLVDKDKLLEILKIFSNYKNTLLLKFNKLENNWYGGWSEEKCQLKRRIDILDLFISKLLKIKLNIDEAEKYKNLPEEKQEILKDFFALEKNKNFEIVVNSKKNQDLYNYLVAFRNLVLEFIQKKDIKIKDDLEYKLRLNQTIADLETFLDLENGSLINISLSIFGNKDTKCLCKIVNRIINILKKIRGDNTPNSGGWISKIINGDIPEKAWDLLKKIG